MTVYQRILVAVDLSPDSLFIGQRARSLSAVLDAELYIIHVVEPVPLVVPVPPEPVVPSLVMTQAQMVETAQEHIGELGKELGVPEARRHVVEGNTRSEIVRMAIDRAIDLIVIGSHERHALAFFIKPTEDVVVHRAPCDVLAVHLK